MWTSIGLEVSREIMEATVILKLIMVVVVVVLFPMSVMTRTSTVMSVIINKDDLVMIYFKVRFSYRAWWLHPWFSINLHGESLPGLYYNRRALCQATT
jgi:hypothetical protein